MNEVIGHYQYFVAWAVYIGSGLIFSLFWWKLTKLVAHRGWRELLRGISLVVIYTPWFTGEAHEHLAPAMVVVLIDLLLGTTDNGRWRVPRVAAGDRCNAGDADWAAFPWGKQSSGGLRRPYSPDGIGWHN